MQRLILTILALLAATLTLPACGPVTFTIDTGGANKRLTSSTVIDEPGAGATRVAIIDVTGMIYNASRRHLLGRGENPVSLLHEKLQAVRADHNVKAVILRINSPGGTVTASDAMYRQIVRFKADTATPVIALMMDVTASGGYYIACAADHCIAYPSTVTGSIGVVMQLISLKPLMTRWGIDAQAITSGPNKAAGSPLATLTDEQRAIFQSLVDDFYSRFTQVVRDARPNIPPDQFATVTDGRIFSGAQALDAGLIDQVGDLHDAFSLAKRKAGVERADLILYRRPAAYAGSPYATTSNTPANATPNAMPNATTQINLAQFNFANDAVYHIGGTPVGFYYLWSLD